MEEKYKWTATLSAPKEYQMQVYYGQLIADGFKETGTLYNGTILPLDFYTSEIENLFKEKLDRNLPAEIVLDGSTGDAVKLSLQQNSKTYPLEQMVQYVKPQK